MEEELIIMDKLKAKEAELERGLSETSLPTGILPNVSLSAIISYKHLK
jgi:hypothetical protein